MIKNQQEQYIHLRLAKVSADDPLHAEKLIENLTAISRSAEQCAQAFAVDQIRTGKLSRIQASKLLGVHQATVARWVKKGIDKPT